MWLVSRYLAWITTNFVVTTDRLIYRSGVISKRGIEIPLERVNTVFFAPEPIRLLPGACDHVGLPVYATLKNVAVAKKLPAFELK